MTFSVTVPAFKPQFLEECILSVLGQSFTDFELIIVDDHSPADLASIIAPFLSDSRVRYYRNEENVGAVDVVSNWNRCLGYCRGDYMICMGDDDRLLPDCLKDYADLIKTVPDLGVYHMRTQIIDEKSEITDTLEGRPQYESSLEMLEKRLQGRTQFIGDFCFRVSLLRSNNGFFYLPLAWGSDDLTAYIAAKGNGNDIVDGIANAAEPGFQYRVHSQTISSQRYSRVKLDSLISLNDWLLDDLRKRKEQEPDKSGTIDRVGSELKQYMRRRARFFIRNDIAERHRGTLYWVKRRNGLYLSVFEIAFLSLKALLKGAC